MACEVWLASCLTSEATTAKPLPVSPARAASIVAFSARRLVCAAILEMSSTTEPMCFAASSSERMAWVVRSASLTVVRAIANPRSAWWPISAIECDSSSDAGTAIPTDSLVAPSAVEADAVRPSVSLAASCSPADVVASEPVASFTAPMTAPMVAAEFGDRFLDPLAAACTRVRDDLQMHGAGQRGVAQDGLTDELGMSRNRRRRVPIAPRDHVGQPAYDHCSRN